MDGNVPEEIKLVESLDLPHIDPADSALTSGTNVQTLSGIDIRDGMKQESVTTTTTRFLPSSDR